MLNKTISVIFVFLCFVMSIIFLVPHDKNLVVTSVISPTQFKVSNSDFKLKKFDTFDKTFSENNAFLAKKLGISEIEAFIFGNLAFYWSENLMKGRSVYVKDNDLIYLRTSYQKKFERSGFCIKDYEPCVEDLFNEKLQWIRKSKFYVLDLDNDKVYKITDTNIRHLTNYLVLRKTKNGYTNEFKNKFDKNLHLRKFFPKFEKEGIKVFVSDLTTKLKPNRNCESLMCKEILSNIEKSKSTIDIAIYGYSRVPAIEKAVVDATKRGVQVRLVYDTDKNGENIYHDTPVMTKLLPNNKTDNNSPEVANIMHNKFYIFDDKTLITGSANLAHTDMSDFNTNSMIVLKSKDAIKIYKDEFEQLFSGKFHNDKLKSKLNEFSDNGISFKVFFSPQDKGIVNGILPIINSAKVYIYIPTFVLTEKRVVDALIEAHSRGVEVKVIIDALNASGKYSKHSYLRNAGINVKTENYAGKMHSKSMIVDDKYTVIGSMNFSNSGENKNDENFVIIEDSDLAKFYKDFFLYQWDKIDNKWLKHNARAEGKDSIGSCYDGLDNNYDGLTDFEDPACK